MIFKIIRFDLGRYFRSISTYVYFVLLAAVACLLMVTAGGAFQGASVSMGGGGKVLVNSPYSLAVYTSALSYYGLLIVSAIAGKAAFRDFEEQTHSFFFTAPIGKTAYLGGRFIASIVILLAIFSSFAVGLALGTVMPFVDHALFGPNHLLAYIQPYLVTVIPNVLITGALFFSMAGLTRKILPVYVTSVILLIGYLIAASLSNKIEDKFIAALLDPFGQIAMGRLTEYWTVSEKNARMITMAGALLWNRLLWTGVAVALMVFTYFKFQFVYALEARGAGTRAGRADTHVGAGVPVPHVTRNFSAAAHLRAMLRLTRLGFR
jgi:ABC-2 type transport system permease protein